MSHPMSNAEAAVELERVARALDQTQLLVTGMDRVVAAMTLDPEVRHSALRTLVEHSQEALGRVITHLRTTRP